MKKKILLLVIILSLFYLKNVSALEYSDTFNEHGMWISNEYVNKSKNGKTKYQQMTMIVRNRDNRFVYCIEPGTSMDSTSIIKGYDTNQANYANLTSSEYERIKLLAYYGYGYKEHTDIKWYVITQFMIWQSHNLGYDIYFTDKLNGNRINKYEQEMEELNKLVLNHYKTPDFGSNKLSTFLGEKNYFYDKNNVLDKYSINNGPNISGVKNNNSIELSTTDPNNSFLILTKEEKRFGNKPTVYIDATNQNLILPGDYEKFDIRYVVEKVYGNISIQKLDSTSKTNIPSGNATLENAKYGLYNLNDELLEDKYTNKNGLINFDTKLIAGTYYVKELEASKGYLLDDVKYYFDINSNSYNVKLDIYEKVISENFEIIKVINDDEKSIMEYEKNIEFEIFSSDNILIGSYFTDNYGTIKFTLPYGKYLLHQKTTYFGYDKIDDYELNVVENNKNNKLVFKNNRIKYKVILNVFDKKTTEFVKNIKFELNYKDKIIKYSTLDTGKIIFAEDFCYGKYLINLIHDNSFEYNYESDVIKLDINDETSYILDNNNRVIELNMFLEKKVSEDLIDEKEIFGKDDLEDKMLEETGVFEELDDEINLNDNSVKNISNDKIQVKLPNTFKNDYYIYIMVLLVIIKKLLKN